MNIKKIILITLIIMMNAHQTWTQEYLYPVAGIKKNNERYLYLLYQKDVTHIELLLWHEKTKIISKVLPSSCIPAGVRILPHQKGFSFIDNGLIKIKLFNKRSAKTVPCSEAIYQAELIQWIDEHNFYFCAKKNGSFGIFQSNSDGLTHPVCMDASLDYIYPQKIDDTLFFIERTHEQKPHYTIKSMAYPIPLFQKSDFNTAHDFDGRVEQLLQSQQHKQHASSTNVADVCIHDNGQQSIAFLRMMSDSLGYFIQHANSIKNDDSVITLNYCQLKKEENSWHAWPLFSFKIPLLFLQDESGSGYSYRSENPSRIYESMLALLPCHDDNRIYYMSTSENDRRHLCLYSYAKDTQRITKHKNNAPLSDMFGAIIFDGTLFYGGTLQYSQDIQNNDRFLCKIQQRNDLPLGMWIDNEGNMCYDQPKI